jgi:hypothetical protein
VPPPTLLSESPSACHCVSSPVAGRLTLVFIARRSPEYAGPTVELARHRSSAELTIYPRDAVDVSILPLVGPRRRLRARVLLHRGLPSPERTSPVPHHRRPAPCITMHAGALGCDAGGLQSCGLRARNVQAGRRVLCSWAIVDSAQWP